MGTTLLSIGDFSRMTYLSIKALRYYHDVGVLEPADIDPTTGYRRYATEQIPVAQVVRRFRDLGMPLDEIRTLLDAPDVATRNATIAAHLRRMEQQLAGVQSTVASLRRLLEPSGGPLHVEYRSVPAARVLAVAGRIAMSDFEEWWPESVSQLNSAVLAAGARRTGPDGALYHEEYFTSDAGEVVAFVPIAEPVPDDGRADAAGRADATGRERFMELPAAEFAVVTHLGGLDTIDQTYGALGTYVAERELGVDGPIRENYLVTAADTADETQHRAEVCWPIFHTTAPR